jgi:hypothetical protein
MSLKAAVNACHPLAKAMPDVGGGWKMLSDSELRIRTRAGSWNSGGASMNNVNKGGQSETKETQRKGKSIKNLLTRVEGEGSLMA